MEQAITISMKRDLRKVLVAQAAYFSEYDKYSTAIDPLEIVPNEGNVVRLTRMEEKGWAAEVRNPTVKGVCVIWVNLPEEERPRTTKNKRRGAEGEPVCDLDP